MAATLLFEDLLSRLQPIVSILVIVGVKASFVMHNNNVLNLVIGKLGMNLCHIWFSIRRSKTLKCMQLCKVFLTTLLDILTFMPIPIHTFLVALGAVSKPPNPPLTVAD